MNARSTRLGPDAARPRRRSAPTPFGADAAQLGEGDGAGLALGAADGAGDGAADDGAAEPLGAADGVVDSDAPGDALWSLAPHPKASSGGATNAPFLSTRSSSSLKKRNASAGSQVSK